ncbi:hypothetical protein FKM82_014522 [Ascaphus truei]
MNAKIKLPRRRHNFPKNAKTSYLATLLIFSSFSNKSRKHKNMDTGKMCCLFLSKLTRHFVILFKINLL